MNGEVVALLLIFGVHLLALAVIVGPLMRFRHEGDDSDGAWPSDDDGGGGARRPLCGPTSPRPGSDLPLPDTVPAGLRLRGPGRLADARRSRPRRGVTPPRRVRLHD